MSKVLMISSVASMIDLFNRDNIEILEKLGYNVVIGTNFINGSLYSTEQSQFFRDSMEKSGKVCYHVPIPRSVFQLVSIFKSIKITLEILKRENIELVHCHSPIGSVVARLAALIHNIFSSFKTKVIYTAHGFHFFKNAPLKNWMIFYPIEKILGKFTDILITINLEDYEIGRKICKRCFYVPGIGVDVEKDTISLKFNDLNFYFNSNNFNIISVGELNNNKNHGEVLRAISLLKANDIHYYICGSGANEQLLKDLAKDLGLDKNLHLLGFRTDAKKIVSLMDLFVFPSIREGLPVSLMEAMNLGVPCIASNIRGSSDLLNDYKESLYDLHDIQQLAFKINNIYTYTGNESEINYTNRVSYLNPKFMKKSIRNQMEEIYKSIR